MYSFILLFRNKIISNNIYSLWYIWKISLTFSILHLPYLIKSNNWIDKIESNSSILHAQKAATQKD